MKERICLHVLVSLTILKQIAFSRQASAKKELLGRKYVIDPTKFCLSTDWVSWHYMRLIYAIALEYSYLEITGSCPKDERAEHDLMDIEYLTFLARSDNLLTCDNKLQYLAEVALSNKKFFSKVQDIDG